MAAAGLNRVGIGLSTISPLAMEAAATNKTGAAQEATVAARTNRLGSSPIPSQIHKAASAKASA